MDKTALTFLVIGLLVIGLGVWLFFLLKPKKPKKNKKPKTKQEGKNLEEKKKVPPRKPEDIELAKKMDEFIVMNPKYATELIRGWLNEKRRL